MTGLAHRMVPEDGGYARAGTMYVLHGFLGAGRNWASFARRLVTLRPDWRVVLVDLRLHAGSRHLRAPHDIAACAEDVIRLATDLGAGGSKAALLGHSFGGKVALTAASVMSPAPTQVWVVDSTPGPTPTRGASWTMLDLVRQSPERFQRRGDAVAWIRAGGFDEPTARWMAMNLVEADGSWHWGLDVAGLESLLADFAHSDLWAELESSAARVDFRFVQASRQSAMSREDRDRLLRLGRSGLFIEVRQLEGGHWLHVDNPRGTLDLVAEGLPAA